MTREEIDEKIRQYVRDDATSQIGRIRSAGMTDDEAIELLRKLEQTSRMFMATKGEIET